MHFQRCFLAGFVLGIATRHPNNTSNTAPLCSRRQDLCLLMNLNPNVGFVLGHVRPICMPDTWLCKHSPYDCKSIIIRTKFKRCFPVVSLNVVCCFILKYLQSQFNTALYYRKRLKRSEVVWVIALRNVVNMNITVHLASVFEKVDFPP